MIITAYLHHIIYFFAVAAIFRAIMSMKKFDEQMSAGVAHEEVMADQLAGVRRLWRWTKRRESYGSTPLAGWRRWRPPGQSLVTWSVAAIVTVILT